MVLRASYLVRCPLPLPPSYRVDRKREVGDPADGAPPSTWWAEYGLVANPVKAGLRPPPSAAIGLDRAYHEASVCHQRVDGGIRPLPLTIYAEMAPQSLRKGWRLGGLIQVAIGFAGGSGSFLTN